MRRSWGGSSSGTRVTLLWFTPPIRIQLSGAMARIASMQRAAMPFQISAAAGLFTSFSSSKAT